MNIIIYSESTGEILRSVSCPAYAATLQVGTGEAFIEHDEVDDSQFMVDVETETVIAKP